MEVVEVVAGNKGNDNDVEDDEKEKEGRMATTQGKSKMRPLMSTETGIEYQAKGTRV